MGPRSDEHGNRTAPGFPASLKCASMGPRSDEHGNADRVWVGLQDGVCFNGAAFG